MQQSSKKLTIWRRWLSRGAVSETHAVFLAQLRRRELGIHLSQILILAIGLFLWELGARCQWFDSFITSQPSKISQVIVDLWNSGKLWLHIGTTVGETAIGLVVGTSAGTLIAIILWWSKWVAAVLDPYIVVLNSIPKVALGPVFIVWLGSGSPAIIAMSLAISVIITIMMVFNGFSEVSPEKIKLMNSFGARRGQVLMKVVLPATLPTIMAALKVNLGLSLVGAIVGEFLVSKQGLGYLIVYGGQVFNMALVMASILILCVVALLLYYGMNLLDRKLIRWKN